MLDVLNCIMTVLTTYCVWLALADHTAPASGKYTSAVMRKRWGAARRLAKWHGGSLSSTSVQLCKVTTCCVRLVPGGVGFYWL